MDSIRQILARLNEHEVEFVVVVRTPSGSTRDLRHPKKDLGFRPRLLKMDR